jgi:hypothetical protein
MAHNATEERMPSRLSWCHTLSMPYTARLSTVDTADLGFEALMELAASR